jgi:four helix bundle protein
MTESFRNLVVWQESKAFVKEIYLLTKSFPKEELYCLTSQMRRAAISVPSNIAEGKGRNTDKDFRHFLMQARGSLYEVENQLEIAADLQYLERERLHRLVGECNKLGRQLNALVHTIDRVRHTVAPENA